MNQSDWLARLFNNNDYTSYDKRDFKSKSEKNTDLAAKYEKINSVGSTISHIGKIYYSFDWGQTVHSNDSCIIEFPEASGASDLAPAVDEFCLKYRKFGIGDGDKEAIRQSILAVEKRSSRGARCLVVTYNRDGSNSATTYAVVSVSSNMTWVSGHEVDGKGKVSSQYKDNQKIPYDGVTIGLKSKKDRALRTRDAHDILARCL